MKFGPTVLLEIVDIIQNGIVMQKDVSQDLRDIDVVEDNEGTLELSKKYYDLKGRKLQEN